MKSYVAKDKVADIITQGSDCIILVSNAIEGAEFARTLNALGLDKKIPIISHWGITGGDFHKHVNHDLREKLDLSFVQSCFSFLQNPLPIKAVILFCKTRYR